MGNGQGLSIQRTAIEQYCGATGLALVGFFEDAGISGANGIGQREGWLGLIEGLREGRFSVVVISRLDRQPADPCYRGQQPSGCGPLPVSYPELRPQGK